MDSKSFYESMKQRKDNVDAFIRRQRSADTIVLMGPTSSAKSTVITELLPPVSNKLLGKNVGVTAQTTLLSTRLMLNARLTEDEVLVQCIPRRSSAYMDFIGQAKATISDALYDQREEIESFEVNDKIIESILDPTDRRYHAYQFAFQHGLTSGLIVILGQLCQRIINDPEPLTKEADKRYKQIRIKDQHIKKREVYEQIVDERFFTECEDEEKIRAWYTQLKKTVEDELESLWTFPEIKTLLGSPDGDEIPVLIEKLYSKDSACSLVFEEVLYATSPAQLVREEYQRLDPTYSERTVKFNVLDTVGLTQSTQFRDDISDNMDVILSKDSNALLFLCASDEQPSVYETCLELLKDKEKKLAQKPVTICRTKADIAIRNIMIDKWRQDHGTNTIADEQYPKYIKTAYQSYCDEYLSPDNAKAGGIKNCKIELLSLASDISSKMNPFLNNALDNKRIIHILFDLSARVEKSYEGGRLWLQSKDLIHYPLKVSCLLEQLAKTIGLAMTAQNNDNHKQYTQYIDAVGTFHGRSANCFRRKLQYGEGHETHATMFLDFRLYIPNIVARWLREALPKDDIIRDIYIDFNNLQDSKQTEKVRADFPQRLRDYLDNDWEHIIRIMAKNLSYDCFKDDFEKAFVGRSWDEGFRKSLMVIREKYSSNDYWEKNIPELIEKIANMYLRKMYIFD